MFNTAELVQLRKQVKELNGTLEKHDEIKSREIEDLKRKHTHELEDAKRAAAKELDAVIKKQHEENELLKIENAVIKKEVDILKKAFENMGFDVRDMKSILNKLVEGIVGKNQVHVIK